MPACRKISCVQYEELVTWMELHPVQARATQVQTPHVKRTTHRLWEELASRLNAVSDGVTKNVREWRQYWSDQKCKLRKKWTAIEQHGDGTGGASAWDGALSPHEERILAIMGVQNGVGSKNVGFDDSLPPLAPHSRPITPELPQYESGQPTKAVAECETTQPPSISPQTPPETKYSVPDADADDHDERSRSPIAPPRWTLDIENHRNHEEKNQMERQMAERERRVAMEERILALQERTLALEERRMALEERSTAEDRTWRRDILSALHAIAGNLGQPPIPPPSPFRH